MPALVAGVFRRAILRGAHCLIENVTEDPAPMTGVASPNRAGGADGETDQHGRAARGGVGGGGALSGGRTAREGRILGFFDRLTGAVVP
jgi:hypothetical protein